MLLLLFLPFWIETENDFSVLAYIRDAFKIKTNDLSLNMVEKNQISKK